MDNKTTALEIQNELKELGDPKRAEHSKRYFKTGPGEYGENDIFWGIAVPKVRAVSKKAYPKIDSEELKKLLVSPIHEVRQAALFMLVEKYNAFSRKKLAAGVPPETIRREKKEIFLIYTTHLAYINNWDLIDNTAPHILGQWFLETDPALGQKQIKEWSNSKSIWEQRTAVMTTQAFLKKGIFEPTLDLCVHFLSSKHDLIHKATGWMLREIGEENETVLIQFLEKYASDMPRTMLRYSIEKLAPKEKEKYMTMKSKKKE